MFLSPKLPWPDPAARMQAYHIIKNQLDIESSSLHHHPCLMWHLPHGCFIQLECIINRFKPFLFVVRLSVRFVVIEPVLSQS